MTALRIKETHWRECWEPGTWLLQSFVIRHEMHGPCRVYLNNGVGTNFTEANKLGDKTFHPQLSRPAT